MFMHIMRIQIEILKGVSVQFGLFRPTTFLNLNFAFVGWRTEVALPHRG